MTLCYRTMGKTYTFVPNEFDFESSLKKLYILESNNNGYNFVRILDNIIIAKPPKLL